METALYFPHISLPNNSWLTRTLLYWEGVASVVPKRVSAADPELTPFMEDLINADLVRKVTPERAKWENRGEFDASFLALLDASRLAESTHPRQWTRINGDKGTIELFDQIAARGLAKMDEYAWDWCSMEQRTAGLYMAYLVGSICRAEGDLVPVTDVDHRLAQLAHPAVSTKSELDELVYVTIHDVLPIPAAEISLDDLRRFKDVHAGRLRDLRVHLTAKLADLALIQDQYVRAAKLADAKREVSESVERLQQDMNRRRWPVLLGGAAALASPLLGAGTAVVSGGTALALGLGLASAAAGIGAAATGLRLPTRVDLASPVAYAALAARLRPS